MFCEKCRSPIAPGQVYCSVCGAPNPAASMQPAPVTVPVTAGKKFSTLMIIGIVMVAIAVVGLIYGLTDNAKIIGKWSNSYGGKAEFDLSGTVKVQNYYGSVVSSPYSLRNGKLVTSFYGQTTEEDFSIEGADQLIVEDITFTRTDFPFFVIVIGLSGLLAIGGVLLILIGNKSKGFGKPTTSGYTPVTPGAPVTPGYTPATPGAPVTPGYTQTTPGAPVTPANASRFTSTMKQTPTESVTSAKTPGEIQFGGDL